MKEGIKVEEEIQKNRKLKVRQKITGKKVFFEIIEWVVCFLIAYILYLVINYFFGTISCVKQTSMYPTAKEGEKEEEG